MRIFIIIINFFSNEFSETGPVVRANETKKKKNRFVFVLIYFSTFRRDRLSYRDYYFCGLPMMVFSGFFFRFRFRPTRLYKYIITTRWLSAPGTTTKLYNTGVRDADDGRDRK